MYKYLIAAAAALGLSAPAFAEAAPVTILAKGVALQGVYNPRNAENRLAPLRPWQQGEVVIRSAEELAALSVAPDQAKDPAVQETLTHQLAQTLKVEAIDWKTQMVVGVARSLDRGIVAIDAVAASHEGSTLTVQLAVTPVGCRVLGSRHYAVLALVGRSDDAVKFVAFNPQSRPPQTVVSQMQTREVGDKSSLAVGPVQSWGQGEVVIRTAEELAARSATPDQARDAETQQKLTRELAATLKVEKIDWETQMVVGVSKELGNFRSSLEVASLNIDRDRLHVQLAVRSGFQRPCSTQSFVVLALVPRCDGEVKFLAITPETPKK